MYYIHYPSGGFGHFMLQMSSICFDDVFCPQQESSFRENSSGNGSGTSHFYPTHYTEYTKENTPKALFDFKDKKSICLIDSGAEFSKDLGHKNTIRMCIDSDAKSIVFQTCSEKALQSSLEQEANIDTTMPDFIQREKYSLTYHYSDKNPDFYLNCWKPTSDTININISDLFFNPHRVVAQLEPHFGKCDWGKFWKLWNEFITANHKYYQAQHLVNRVKYALEADFDFKFTKNYSLHDQGYLIYWLERQYNIQEIPPYDYRHWFKNTQEIRDCLNSIRSQ